MIRAAEKGYVVSLSGGGDRMGIDPVFRELVDRRKSTVHEATTSLVYPYKRSLCCRFRGWISP